ncbi:MAG: phosphate ABC transporter ATPase, partial [Clostridia bacterium]|nr:phosphate ABC transporter ATPase [Clostridia bacterium]
MLIKIGNFDFTEVWDGVLYKKLSTYPQISDWEIRNLTEFIDYEKANGRNCTIECENEKLLAIINEKIADRSCLNAPRPYKITECTACRHKGCLTDYVCHTTSVENAVSILNCGSILSAVRARNLPAEVLMKEKCNAAKDPADYFDYVMFSWGNCQAGDRLVMERKLGRFPNQQDLSEEFQPGIRFYFKY